MEEERLGTRAVVSVRDVTAARDVGLEVGGGGGGMKLISVLRVAKETYPSLLTLADLHHVKYSCFTTLRK